MRPFLSGAWRLPLGTALALSVALTSAVRAAPPSDSEADADDDGTQTDREPCALADVRGAVLVKSTERQSCGARGCTQTEWLSLESSKGDTWLSLQNELGDFAERSPFSVSCEGGSVHVRPDGDDNAPELRFRFDRASRGLRLAPEISAALDESFRRTPVTDITEIARRQTLVTLLEAVLPASGSAPDAPRGPSGIGRPLLDSMRLLVARDELESGAWDAAERDLGLVAFDAPRRAELVAALAAVRDRTRPLTLSSRRRLGTFSQAPATPLTPDQIPALFWRGDELCVAQEDATPAVRMRCFSPARRRWSGAVPLAVPESGGQKLRGMWFPSGSHCEGYFVAQKRVPESGTPCADGFGVEESELVAVVEHDAMLVRSPQDASGLSLNRGPHRDQALPVEQANALIRASPGSLVLGDGCCFLTPDGQLGRIKGRDEQRWNALGEPPPGEQWSGTALASPDQRWVVAGSGVAQGGKTTLWLFHVERP